MTHPGERASVLASPGAGVCGRSGVVILGRSDCVVGDTFTDRSQNSSSVRSGGDGSVKSLPTASQRRASRRRRDPGPKVAINESAWLATAEARVVAVRVLDQTGHQGQVESAGRLPEVGLCHGLDAGGRRCPGRSC